MNTEQKLENQRAALFGTYAPPALEFTHGAGSYLFERNGQAYLDFFAGIAVNCLGHAHPELLEALTVQANKLWHTSNAFRVPQGEQLAQELAQRANLDRVFFTNSGTESVECGLKMMRRYHFDHGRPERFRIIGMQGAFHGRSFAAVCAAGNAEHTKGFVRADEGYDHVPFNDISALEQAIGPETAGIIVEPVQGEGGIRPAQDGYLAAVKALCEQHDILLMFDEVQCGIGRLGQLFAFQHYGVQPDILALAKGLGGGFPVGASVASEAVAASMVVGTHGSTYGGNPLAMAVASRVLEIIGAEDFLGTVRERAEYFQQGLQTLVNAYPQVLQEYCGTGLMLGLRCKEDGANTQILKFARARFLLLTKAAGNVVRILPPLNCSTEEVDEAIEKLDGALQDYIAAGG